MSDEQKEVKQTNDNLDDLGIDGLPRDSALGWFKFENIGDAIGGEVVDMFFQPDNGNGAQRVFTLKRTNGEIWNVGLKWNSHTQSRTDQVQIGDMLGLRFDKEIPPKVKGHSPAKSIAKLPKFVSPRKHSQSAAVLAGEGSVPHVEDEASEAAAPRAEAGFDDEL